MTTARASPGSGARVERGAAEELMQYSVLLSAGFLPRTPPPEGRAVMFDILASQGEAPSSVISTKAIK